MESNLLRPSSQEKRTLPAQSSLFSWLKRHQLVAFFVLVFGISWSGWFLLLIFQSGLFPFKVNADSLAGTFLSDFPHFGPAISALTLTALLSGKQGMREYFSRLIYWRVGLQWYAVALFFPVVMALAVMALSLLLIGPLPRNPSLTAWYSPIVWFFLLVLIQIGLNALAEEPGWRGYALPRLLSQHHALLAAVILGLLWGLWHLPLFLLGDVFDANGPLSFFLFLLQTSGLSILLTWLYLHTERSILFSILFHAAINAAVGLFLGNTTDQFKTTLILTGVIWVAVIIVILISGPRLSREQGNQLLS